MTSTNIFDEMDITSTSTKVQYPDSTRSALQETTEQATMPHTGLHSPFHSA